MATLNVSDEQKTRVKNNVKTISKKLGTAMSQATIVDMGMALLEDKYNTK